MPNPLSPLLFDDAKHRMAVRETDAFCREYLEKVPEMPVFPNVDRASLRAIMDAPLPRQGANLETLFRELRDVIVPNSVHTAHPRFLPYVQASPNGLAPYAEQIAATLNQNCNLWTLSPAANAVEQAVLRWFAELFGLGPEAGGILTSGGSVANLVGLAAARDVALGTDARNAGLQGAKRLTLYMSDEAHSSIDKAVSILGLGLDNLRRIPTDDTLRMDVRALRAAMDADRANGAEPFCVVASAGTVTTGAIDPLDEIGAACREYGAWLHVDGAYGALAAMSPRYGERLSGLRHADSVSFDPHKFLFASFEAGCVLVRKRDTLTHAFAASPSYLAMQKDEDFIDFANYGPQLSRGFRALKVWWSLKYFGADAFAQTIERMADLASYMGETIERSDVLKLIAPVTLNCVCFRLRGRGDAANRTALQRLVQSGKAFLGPASVKGVIGMRACFMNLRTTRKDVDYIVEELETLAR